MLTYACAHDEEIPPRHSKSCECFWQVHIHSTPASRATSETPLRHLHSPNNASIKFHAYTRRPQPRGV